MVSAVVSVTVIRVLLFVWDVSVLRECKSDGNAGVRAVGCVVTLSVGCDYMGSTCGSGIVSSTYECGVRGVGGVCEICMCLG